MLELISTVLSATEAWILAMAASPWIYPAMFAFATIDGFFPPVPSESSSSTLTVVGPQHRHAAGCGSC